MIYDFWLKDKRHPVSHWIIRKNYEWMAAYLRRHGCREPILDVGSGKGDFKEYWQDYRGIDHNELLCRQTGAIHGSATNLPIEDGAVETYVALHVLDHMSSFDSAMKMISEAWRVLRPGGHIVLVIPNYAVNMGHIYNYDHTHNFVTTPHRTVQMLEDMGFTMERHRTIVQMGVVGWMLMPIFQVVGVLTDWIPYYSLNKFQKLRAAFMPNFMLVARKPCVS